MLYRKEEKSELFLFTIFIQYVPIGIFRRKIEGHDGRNRHHERGEYRIRHDIIIEMILYERHRHSDERKDDDKKRNPRRGEDKFFHIIRGLKSLIKRSRRPLIVPIRRHDHFYSSKIQARQVSRAGEYHE